MKISSPYDLTAILTCDTSPESPTSMHLRNIIVTTRYGISPSHIINFNHKRKAVNRESYFRVFAIEPVFCVDFFLRG